MTDITRQRYRIRIPVAPMYSAPFDDAECTSEYLYGEIVQSTSAHATESDPACSDHVKNTGSAGAHNSAPSHWLAVYAERDNYFGYMQSSHLQVLTADASASSHWVCTRSTLLFHRPSIKSPVLARLPFLSRVVSQPAKVDDFHELQTGGFIWSQHLLTGEQIMDCTAIELAQSHFLGAPYLWGGCSPAGLDCSGLIQALALAKGIRIPRDSVDQEQALHTSIAAGDQREQDIVYWPGHTGILLDASTLLHATAHSLDCRIEPLQDVVERAGEISSIKRLFS